MNIEEAFVSYVVRGKLVTEPVMRYTEEGTALTSFIIVVNRPYKTAEGERKEWSEFFKVQTTRTLAENCNQYLEKSQHVTVMGDSIQAEAYTTRNGEERKTPVLRARSVQFGPRNQAEEAEDSF